MENRMTVAKNNVTNMAMRNKFGSNKGSIIVRDIPISLVCMAEYQRPCGEKRVARIVEEFNPGRMSPIKVSHRNGMFYCVDGQHRVNAYKKMGLTTIQAQVMSGLTFEEEAFLFAEQHRNEVNVNKRAEWNARVIAADCDPSTQEIISTMNNRGYAITFCGTTSQSTMDHDHKHVSAIRELQAIYNNFGVKGLEMMVDILDGAWNGAPYSTHRCIIGGLHRIMQTHNLTDYHVKRMISKLKEVSPKEVLDRAHKLGAKSSKNVGIVMCNLFNARLADNNKHRLMNYKI